MRWGIIGLLLLLVSPLAHGQSKETDKPTEDEKAAIDSFPGGLNKLSECHCGLARLVFRR